MPVPQMGGRASARRPGRGRGARAGVCSVTGLPAVAALDLPSSRLGSDKNPAAEGSGTPLGGAPGRRLHARPTRTARSCRHSRRARPRARSLRLRLPSSLGVPPTPWRAQTPRARRGTGRSGLPSPPPTWGRLSAQPGRRRRRHRASRRCPAGRRRPPGHGRAGETGDGTEGWGRARGVTESGGPRSSPGQDRGNAVPRGLCTRSTDRASCSRAAADHAWPREPIGRSLTHLCR